MDSNGPSAVECRPPHNSDQLFVDLNEPPSSSSGSYEPKAHIGWASFGESIDPPSPANKTVAPVQLKRKVYVVRSQNRDKSKPYHIVSNKTRKTALDVIEPSKPEPTVMANNVSSDSDEDVDVVGIDDDDDTGSLISPAVQPTTVPLSLTSDLQLPPDLPPQPSFGSRFGMKAKRGELRQGYESDVDDLRFPGNLSPPPRLEPQTSDSTGILKAQDSISDGKTEESAPDERLRIDDVDSSQILKTKVSSSAIPILPLSKSIMERKKVALGMTKNAVVKKLTPPKTPFKNFTVAPKNVQIPAYSENTSMTLYSNVNKAVSFHKDNRGRCIRCRERSPVDMSTFKFLEDTTVVAVRAHLCDQTRVMIARTAIWNREYAKRLGERAAGTVWQKPDEVTAQMTGFCSATVRRCIDIANLSIVPRCADRIGVSKNELASLKTSFGNEKFLGQTMRTPHVLSQYYAVKAQSSATDSVPSSSDGPPPLLRMGRAPSNQDKNEEEERKHHPLTYYQPSSISKPEPADRLESTAIPPLKKTVLRWTSIHTPRILRPPGLKQQTPKMAVIPVMKNKAELKKSITTPAATGPKKRGRPRKVKSTEVVAQPSSRCLRSHKRDSASILVDNEVQETIRSLINEVCELVSIETS